MRGKKLTNEEFAERQVKKVLKNIIGMEQTYPRKSIERACWKYRDANSRKRKAQEDIQVLEKKLAQAKGDLK